MPLQVELVSPERILFSGEADHGASCRTVGGGDIAFLPGHAPFIGALDNWPVRITLADGSESWSRCTAGSSRSRHNRVMILSDVAELADQIDVDRARPGRDARQERCAPTPTTTRRRPRLRAGRGPPRRRRADPRVLDWSTCSSRHTQRGKMLRDGDVGRVRDRCTRRWGCSGAARLLEPPGVPGNGARLTGAPRRSVTLIIGGGPLCSSSWSRRRRRAGDLDRPAGWYAMHNGVPDANGTRVASSGCSDGRSDPWHDPRQPRAVSAFGVPIPLHAGRPLRAVRAGCGSRPRCNGYGDVDLPASSLDRFVGVRLTTPSMPRIRVDSCAARARPRGDGDRRSAARLWTTPASPRSCRTSRSSCP